MQHRMKENPLGQTQIDALLAKAQVGVFATLNEGGAPYGIPVHYAHLNGKLYLHGLPQGQKIDNLMKDPRVCLTVYELGEYIIAKDGTPCDVNTAYESVIVLGNATMLENGPTKAEALLAIVKKYTPQLAAMEIPEKMIAGTGVIEITPTEITGKYYG
ncbi:pyridoxamine 5'-phosphate oxidase family protein [Ruminococcaceae bacterium OttesenSCG-928-N02]|nr:pyridoxamine 5'-phosphate oxidase family protein [Ruminococcaceae bacterium OttesenSCG-928-N02]